ncbi:proton-coupled folate transporter-like [Chironomus tepperi]|uniref:proton-coupled folate transporter-like n=1 Tax=Chironomus tepperi TaxID=113505 RepID=UPI00391F8962
MEDQNVAENTEESVQINTSPKLSIAENIRKLYNNITVEPLIICWLLPFLITFAAIENMNLEKGCRELVTPEIGFDKDVCKIFVRKDEFDINCPAEGENMTHFENVKSDDIKKKYEVLYASIEDKLPEVYKFLCDAEKKVQKKISLINSIRNPISSIGPLIIILFAGPWSDKKKLRVPCMLVPYIGEALGYFSLFIAAIFINGPVEFPAYAYRLIPSLTGAENLMIMGIFSYLTAVSNEENRTFRFGVFQILMTIIPIIAQSISPTLISRFDYAELFGAMIPVHIIGFMYAIFYLKEPKNKDSKEDLSYDNHALETTSINGTNNTPIIVEEPANSDDPPKNACLEFFDPRHAIYCIRSFIKKREFGLRQIIILFMIMHFLMHGITQGESQNLLLYVRAKLNWDVDIYIYHSVFNTTMGLLGTSFAVGVLSKILQISDVVLIILSTIMSIICRGIYIFAKTRVVFFVGTGIDFMFSVKFLGARSIISKIVPAEDLSTMFAIMGLFEALAGFVFPYMYPTFYQFLLDSPIHDISEMFALSGVIFIVGLMIYILLWKLLKKKEKSETEHKRSSDDTKL